ncbi:MAG: hypothetical protein QM775_06460 [Pirellulales bacterium]
MTLSPEESRRAIVVRPGFTVDLAAHEPLVVDPVAFAWDAQMRLWVVEMNDYPLGTDGQGKPGGRVKILYDDDGDGRLDRGTTFLEGLKYPTAVLPWRDGALVCAVPEIIFARDTDGDGRADERRTLYTGLHVGNPQHLANGLRFGPDGWVHCANGATRTEVKSVATGKSVDVGTRDFRIQPDTGDIEPLYGRSQYLRECDDWGNWFGNSNSNPMYHFALEERYLRRNPHAVFPPAAMEDVSDTPVRGKSFRSAAPSHGSTISVGPIGSPRPAVRRSIATTSWAPSSTATHSFASRFTTLCIAKSSAPKAQASAAASRTMKLAWSSWPLATIGFALPWCAPGPTVHCGSPTCIAL